MGITEAKTLIGRLCSVSWLDRKGQEMRAVSRVNDVRYVPLYGGFMVMDSEDVRIDRITAVYLVLDDGATHCLYDATEGLRMAA